MNTLFKKISATLLICLFCISNSAPLINAQVPINPSFKPELIPDIPSTKTVKITEGKNTKTVKVGDYNANTISIFLQYLANTLIYFAGALAILLIVWGGATYVTSMGRQERMDEAKKTITWAILGLVGIIFSYAVIQFIIRFLIGLPGAGA